MCTVCDVMIDDVISVCMVLYVPVWMIVSSEVCVLWGSGSGSGSGIAVAFVYRTVSSISEWTASDTVH